MRRSKNVLFTLTWCVACAEAPSFAGRPSPALPSTPPDTRTSQHPALPALARSAAPASPVKILAPLDGTVVNAATAKSLVVRVEGPTGAATSSPRLELSLDGERPRPVSGGALAISELLEPGATLANGVHDLVLALVGSDGLALEPSAGGVTSARFFVGARPNPPPAPRIVCLSPFGTHYGSAPSIALDVVFVGLNAGESELPVLEVAIEGGGVSRRARADGKGPFALGSFESGDHVVTVTSARGAPLLPGRCLFSYNRELERSP